MFDFLFHKREMLNLPYRREIHCHIIPGVDDGSPGMEYSLGYLGELQRFGVERIVFTPHHTDPTFLNTPEGIAPLYDKLTTLMPQHDISIVPDGFSFEYRLDETFINMFATGKWGDPQCVIRPLYGHYLLVENAWSQPLASLDQVIDRLQSDGYYPILAHPERYMYYASRNHSRYDHLQDIGLEFQCNILSFAGHYGDTIKKTAYWLLKQGYVNFLGSDLHNRNHCELIEKFLRSKDYAAIRQDLVDSIGNDRM